jgi:hypothetical protein
MQRTSLAFVAGGLGRNCDDVQLWPRPGQLSLGSRTALLKGPNLRDAGNAGAREFGRPVEITRYPYNNGLGSRQDQQPLDPRRINESSFSSPIPLVEPFRAQRCCLLLCSWDCAFLRSPSRRAHAVRADRHPR